MAPQNRHPVLALPVAPSWLEAIPGMVEAEAAALEAHGQFSDAQARKDEADAAVASGVAARTALLARAKAGEVVPGTEVAEVEVAIRAAEANAALLAEVLPALGEQVDAAEAVIRKLVLAERGRFQQAAKAYHRDMVALRASVDRQVEAALNLIEPPQYFGVTAQGRQQHEDGFLLELAPDSYARVVERRAQVGRQAAERQEEQDRREAAALQSHREATQTEAREARKAQEAADRRFWLNQALGKVA